MAVVDVPAIDDSGETAAPVDVAVSASRPPPPAVAAGPSPPPGQLTWPVKRRHRRSLLQSTVEDEPAMDVKGASYTGKVSLNAMEFGGWFSSGVGTATAKRVRPPPPSPPPPPMPFRPPGRWPRMCMAPWNVWGDAVDRVDALVACVVSLLEFGGTVLLLAMSILNMLETGTVELASALGVWSTSLLLASVFVPIAQTIFYNLLLPLGSSVSARLASGQPCWKAVLGVCMQALILPVIVVTSVFGVNLSSATDLFLTVMDDEAAAVRDSAVAEAEVAAATAQQPGMCLRDVAGENASDEIRAVTV